MKNLSIGIPVYNNSDTLLKLTKIFLKFYLNKFKKF